MTEQIPASITPNSRGDDRLDAIRASLTGPAGENVLRLRAAVTNRLATTLSPAPFFVTAENQQQFEAIPPAIAQRVNELLDQRNATQAEINRLTEEINQNQPQQPAPAAAQNQAPKLALQALRGEQERRLAQIDQILAAINGNNLLGEYRNIADIATQFDINTPIPRHDLDLINRDNGMTFNPAANFFINAPVWEFSVYSPDGTRINFQNWTRTLAPFPVTVTEPDRNARTRNPGSTATRDRKLRIENLSLTPGWELDFTNAQFRDSKPWNGGAAVSLASGAEFSLTLAAERRTVNGTPVANAKKITIHNQPAVMDVPAREDAFDALNGGWEITESLTNNFLAEFNEIAREWFFRAIRHHAGSRFDALTDNQKNHLREQLRHKIRWPDDAAAPRAAVAAGAPARAQDTTRFWSELTAAWLTQPDIFRHRITNHLPPEIYDRHARSPDEFRAYLHDNLDALRTDFWQKSLDSILTHPPANPPQTPNAVPAAESPAQTRLYQEFEQFQNAIQENKLDDAHLPPGEQLHNQVADHLGDEITQMDSLDEVGDRRNFWQRTPADRNYLRFFEGSSVNFTNQSVDVATNTAPGARGNPEPVKYNINTHIKKVNKIELTLNIDGENLQIHAGSVVAMTRRILRDQRIPHGKVRAHIAYTFLKSMVKSAQQKNFSLEAQNFQNDTGETPFEQINLDGDRLSFTHKNPQQPRRAQKEFVFDEQRFENTNNFIGPNSAGNPGSLRRGIEEISCAFNRIMNTKEKQYRDATKNREKNSLGVIRSETRTNIPTHFLLSPVRKITNRMLRQKRTFTAQTTASANGKSASISYTEKGKFEITFDGKTYKSRSLGKILKKRVGGKRIFDGLEREIIGKVYESLIASLRENPRVARKNIGVYDEKTHRIYILDQQGDRSFFGPEHAGNNAPVLEKIGNNRQSGLISDATLAGIDNARTGLTPVQQQDLTRNPLLMARVIRQMTHSMLPRVR